jgi:hypothetical protein
MAGPLSCYFLDEPLNEDELGFTLKALLGPWSKFKSPASGLAQKRVPFVVPTPDAEGHYAGSREQRAARIVGNLRRAGLSGDIGRRVVWVMPRDISWDAIFQYAIRIETGNAPYVVQRWFLDRGTLMRGQVRVIDTQMLMEGL